MPQTAKDLLAEFKSQAAKLPDTKKLPKDAIAASNLLGSWVDKRMDSLKDYAATDVTALREQYDDKLKELRALKKKINDAVASQLKIHGALSDQVGHLREGGMALLKALDACSDKDAKAMASAVKAFTIRYSQGGYPGPEPEPIKDNV